MIYRVRIKQGWNEVRFDFTENVVEAGRVDETALQFMRLAAKAFVNDEDDEKKFRCWLEVDPDTSEEF